MSEKRTSRTYIYNLHYFVDEKKISSVIKNIKKSLGTNSIKKTNDDGIYYGFNGDCKKRIIEYLIKKKIVEKKDIMK